MLKNKQGQNIVEFAIVLPVFMLLLVGFMHMALVLHDYMAMGEATREIARYAAVGKSEQDIKAALKIGVSGFYKVDLEKDVTINTNPPADVKLGEYVLVTVKMHFNEEQGTLLTKDFMPKELSTTLKMRKE